jgi:hypothetical protein
MTMDHDKNDEDTFVHICKDNWPQMGGNIADQIARCHSSGDLAGTSVNTMVSALIAVHTQALGVLLALTDVRTREEVMDGVSRLAMQAAQENGGSLGIVRQAVELAKTETKH